MSPPVPPPWKYISEPGPRDRGIADPPGAPEAWMRGFRPRAAPRLPDTLDAFWRRGANEGIVDVVWTESFASAILHALERSFLSAGWAETTEASPAGDPTPRRSTDQCPPHTRIG